MVIVREPSPTRALRRLYIACEEVFAEPEAAGEIEDHRKVPPRVRGDGGVATL